MSLHLRAAQTKKLLSLLLHSTKEEKLKSCHFRMVMLLWVLSINFVMRLRNKIAKISAEIKAHDWSYAWSFIWGNELYNRSVVYSNPIFEKLFKPIMDAKPKKTGLRVPTLLYLQ